MADKKQYDLLIKDLQIVRPNADSVQVADIAVKNGKIVHIGPGLESDAAGLRLLVARLPEVIIAASCSKNMGLYRERTGATLFLGKNRESAEALVSQARIQEVDELEKRVKALETKR